MQGTGIFSDSSSTRVGGASQWDMWFQASARRLRADARGGMVPKSSLNPLYTYALNPRLGLMSDKQTCIAEESSAKESEQVPSCEARTGGPKVRPSRVWQQTAKIAMAEAGVPHIIVCVFSPAQCICPPQVKGCKPYSQLAGLRTDVCHR